MDNDFDGFMKTLDSLDGGPRVETTASFDVDIERLLASDGSIKCKNKNECRMSISTVGTTSKIENEMNAIRDANHAIEPVASNSDCYESKQCDPSNNGGFASMHNEFMQSIKEISDLQLSRDSNVTNVTTSKDLKLSHHKISELHNPKSSIDSRVDAELKQLLETGTCEQQEPEQNDTVELSISDIEDDDHESDSEIILQDIDDLESLASNNADDHNTNKNMDNHDHNDENININNNNNNNDSLCISDSDSNEEEYDLISFGIKEMNHDKPKNTPSSHALRASLPSSSSFEDQSKSKAIVCNSSKSSIASTPCSQKSRASLTKLKQKMKSNKKRKKKPIAKDESDTTHSTPFKTPITKKQKVIQTPRHSLMHSVKRVTRSVSPNIKAQLKQQIDSLRQELSEKEDSIQQMSKEFKEQKAQIERDADAKIKNAEAAVFRMECKLKENAPNINTESDENAQKVNKEIQSLERIIAGLNEENAKLIQQLKEEKIDLRQSQQIMHRENQKINHDLLQTQQQLSDVQESKIEELQPAAYDEIQRLRKQMKDTKKTSTDRERELGIEISKLKEANRCLQFKMDGMNPHNFEQESRVIEEFKKEAFKIQKKSQTKINELEKKLKWYIENQELIENLNQEIKNKNAKIIGLTTSQSVSPVAAYKNHAKQHTTKPSASEHRAIVMLKKKVKDLEKLLASKHPDSIANLISIMNVNPGDDNDGDAIITKQLREQIVFLQETVDKKEDETLSRLRGLKQQNDKVQLALHQKIKNLQQQLTQYKREKGFIKPNTKIKQLERQITELKQSHNRKIKMLKDKKYKSSEDKPSIVNKLQKDVESKTNEEQALNMKLTQKESIIRNLQMMVDSEKQSHNDLKTQIVLLQTQLKNTIKQHENYKAAKVMKQKTNIENDSKIDYNDYNHNHNNEDKHERQKMYEEKIKIMESEIKELKRQCAILTEKVALERSKCEQTVKGMQNQLEWNKLEKEKTKQMVTKLEFELNHAKNTPSYVEYETLLRKLEKIEKRSSDREQELEQAYMRLLRSNDEVEEQLSKKHNDLVLQKDQQIRSLRNELDVLMTAFDKIQTNS